MMKKILYILFFSLAAHTAVQAQDDEDPGGRLRDRMVEYIKTKLSLSKEEGDKFQPVFLDYLKQLRNTKNEYKGDKILLQQKIAELRLRTREQFKPIIGDKKSNEVFEHEMGFLKKVRDELNERRENRQGRADKKTRMLH